MKTFFGNKMVCLNHTVVGSNYFKTVRLLKLLVQTAILFLLLKKKFRIIL